MLVRVTMHLCYLYFLLSFNNTHFCIAFPHFCITVLFLILSLSYVYLRLLSLDRWVSMFSVIVNK